MPSLELDGVSIVLLGLFNPAIFQPMWFKAHGLIRGDEAESAQKITVISPEISQFKIGEFMMEVWRERFMASTNDTTLFQPLRDLVIGAFSLLEHTPIKAIGINRTMHFSIADIDTLNRFGDFLAPKDSWKELMDTPGLAVMIMKYPRANPQGEINVRIEASQKVIPGVYFDVNNHYELKKEETEVEGAMKAINVLKDNWESGLLFSLKIAEHLLGKDY